ncbi:nucleotidyltransferase domain-containing protein [bacterium]|nr:nucleotidyltransferase domain-containing protein [bacterium]
MKPSSIKKPALSVEKMIVNTIIRHARPQRIILFGSRAREDAQERSDYDIAIDDDRLTRAAFAHIRADLEELPTLLAIDLVWMKQATPALRQRILSEGKILYEQKD